jgi:hypothetical protein
MKILLAVLDEILAEHPEHTPVVELILKKVDERVDAEIAQVRKAVRHIGSIIPGSTRTQ